MARTTAENAVARRVRGAHRLSLGLGRRGLSIAAERLSLSELGLAGSGLAWGGCRYCNLAVPTCGDPSYASSYARCGESCCKLKNNAQAWGKDLGNSLQVR